MRIIAHLDMDAFFAAVEERNNPQFKGRPIVVGADPAGGRGVVSTANYKAREYGIRSAMPISRAWQLSEQARRQGKSPAVFLPPNFEAYSEISNRIMEIMRGRVTAVEEAGIDEAYLDLSFAGSYQKAAEICQVIKKEIGGKEGLTASAGIGPNKLVAKIASDMQKPDGLTVVEEKDAEKFLEPLPVRKISGIGPKTEAVLTEEGVKTVKDLKNFSREKLKEKFGKWGLDLYEKVRGCDDSPVGEEGEIKSIGEQETFSEDSRDPNFIFARLKDLCRSVLERSNGGGFNNFRTVVVTVRFSDFETKSRSRTLKAPAGSLNVLELEAVKLLLPFFDKRENPENKMVRLIGVRIEKLK